jgi:hypothetical protein
MTDWESVRIAPEILAKLEAEGSEPVHIIGVQRHDDGTLDMVFRTPDLAVENRRLREDLAQRKREFDALTAAFVARVDRQEDKD